MLYKLCFFLKSVCVSCIYFIDSILFSQYGSTRGLDTRVEVPLTISITNRYLQVGKSHNIYKIYFSTNQKAILYCWNNFIFLNSFRYNYQNYKTSARVFGKYAPPALSNMDLTTSGLFMLHNC